MQLALLIKNYGGKTQKETEGTAAVRLPVKRRAGGTCQSLKKKYPVGKGHCRKQRLSAKEGEKIQDPK